MGPLSFEFVSDRSFLSISVKPKLKDLSETNSKLKGPIWNLINLKDLSEINSKLKGSSWNLRNLKDLCETNVNLKGLREVFGLNSNMYVFFQIVAIKFTPLSGSLKRQHVPSYDSSRSSSFME